jgi:hypothetical protein
VDMLRARRVNFFLVEVYVPATVKMEASTVESPALLSESVRFVNSSALDEIEDISSFSGWNVARPTFSSYEMASAVISRFAARKQ